MKNLEDENSRLLDLLSYNILDTPFESDFDNITSLISKICDTPIATITLVDKEREWFKSVVGLVERENDRKIAFCAQAILSADIFIVSDALEDSRFKENPMVVGHPKIRFYAGVPLISPNGHPLGTLAIKDFQPRQLTSLQIDSLKILAGQAMTQLELRRQNKLLSELSDQNFSNINKLSAVFNQSYLFQGLMDENGILIDVNDIALNACGYLRGDEIGKYFWDTSWWSKSSGVTDYIKDVVHKGKAGQVIHASTDYFTNSGECRQTEFVLTPIKDANQNVVFLLASGQDVTERKKTEIEIARMNRSLRLLSSSNELLIRSVNELELLTKLCELIVSTGNYEMAWVGFANNDPEKSIKPAAHFGNISHIKDIKLTWSDDPVIGRGPAARTIRGGKPVVVGDITRDSGFSPWTNIALKHGFKGVICLPLNHGGTTFGLVAMYTKETFTPITSEVNLLQELADDLAFGIINIRSQEENKKFHEALLKMSKSVTASIDEKFFHQLTYSMIETIGADAGFIAQLTDEKPLKAKTLVAVVNNEIIDNIEYEVSGSPCSFLLENETYVLSKDKNCSLSKTMISLGMQEYIGHQLTSSDGKLIGMIFILMKNITQGTDLAIALLKVFAARASSELARLNSDVHIRNQASLLDKAQDAILVKDLNNNVLFWNRGAERLYGWTIDEALGEPIESLIYPDPTEFRIAMKTLLEKGEWTGEIEQVNKYSKKLMIESHWTLVRDEKNIPQSVFSINTNISDRKFAEEKIEKLAFYDQLTGLPNRTLLTERLKHAFNVCSRYDTYGALLFIDIDNFKSLNDTVGHDVGDLLLKQISQRLSSCIRKTDCVARFGGDEFVVMLENLSKIETVATFECAEISQKILNSLNSPYMLEHIEHVSSASIGITLFSRNDDNITEVLKHADLAMYKAKSSGRNTMQFYDPAMHLEIISRVSLEEDLRVCITKNQLSLHYQPQLDVQANVVGAEALLRWTHPNRGMVSPATFIPIAEDNKMIIQMGKWVIESACKKLVQWRKDTITSKLTVAVNVSVIQFIQPDFVDHILQTIEKYKIDPSKLKIELTESIFISNHEEIVDKMLKLKDKGLNFSLDDFGTGYSSLNHLKKMPLSQLKIDQSFVRDIMHDEHDASIAKTIISLAKILGLEVIAEGVETIDQKNFLIANGCKLFQGYLFSKPLNESDFDTFLMN
ncbi:MAG: diguanylate cyclase [Methylotenera sp.]|nr:MAG: diguanylate cyclase [Methylotenera sp.]